MTLNLKPDTEARLIALAQANGVSVEDFLLHVVEEKTGLTPAPRLNPEQWIEQFEAWADSFPDAPLLPDETLCRENLYPDRWQMPVLVDTNVLVRAVERRHPLMRTARLALIALIRSGEQLCVTSQNVAEFWNVCTRPVNVNGLGQEVPISPPGFHRE